MLEYHSISALVQAAQDSGSTISALVLADQAAQAEAAPEDLYRRMQDNLHDMQEAVQVCASYANMGDYVLLSPACASWGMFKNYEERGRIFKECVNNL